MEFSKEAVAIIATIMLAIAAAAGFFLFGSNVAAGNTIFSSKADIFSYPSSDHSLKYLPEQLKYQNTADLSAIFPGKEEIEEELEISSEEVKENIEIEALIEEETVADLSVEPEAPEPEENNYFSPAASTSSPKQNTYVSTKKSAVPTSDEKENPKPVKESKPETKPVTKPKAESEPEEENVEKEVKEESEKEIEKEESTVPESEQESETSEEERQVETEEKTPVPTEQENKEQDVESQEKETDEEQE